MCSAILEPDEVEEAFIDGIDLDVRGEVFVDLYHPTRDVAIEGVVGAEDADTMSINLIADVMQRSAHLDPQGLGLIAARYGAAVIVGQHDHRNVL